MSGIVYVLTNQAMPNLVKIGRTNNLEKRLRQLDNTSIPLPFECVQAIRVDDSQEVERNLHDVFKDQRTRGSREFFEVSPERVFSALKLTGGKDVTPTDDVVESEEDRQALDKARKRREAFNFSMIGIPVGTVLQFSRDPNQTCQVVSNKNVLFRDEERSLSYSALTLLQELGYRLSACAGPQYWLHNGKTLDEIRQEMESAD